MIRAAMAVTVKIPTQLRSVTGGEAEAQVDDATTVGEVLDGLYDRFDGLRDRIAEDGDLRRFVNVYVGGEDIRFLDGLETAGGVTTAVLRKLADRGDIDADERVVAVITGEGLKTLDAVRGSFETHVIEPSADAFAEEFAGAAVA